MVTVPLPGFRNTRAALVFLRPVANMYCSLAFAAAIFYLLLKTFVGGNVINLRLLSRMRMFSTTVCIKLLDQLTGHFVCRKHSTIRFCQDKCRILRHHLLSCF